MGTSEAIRVSGYDRDLVFGRLVQLQVGCEWPARTNTQGGQSHRLKQTNGEHARIHKRVPPSLESLGHIQHRLPDLGSRLTLVNTPLRKNEKVCNGTDNALRDPRIQPPFHHTYAPVSSSDLGQLRHVFIELLRMLARDSIEHSRKAGVFPERITPHVRAGHSFISSFGRAE